MAQIRPTAGIKTVGKIIVANPNPLSKRYDPLIIRKTCTPARDIPLSQMS